MKHITFYLDFISPYAYLAFERLPVALQGLSVQVTYKPILFASLLKHHGQLGPAEITPKREWTYRQVLWQARQLRVPLDMPASHPFNPLTLLRLAVACAKPGSEPGCPNRHVAETIFRHVWHGGQEATDAHRLTALIEQLRPLREPTSEDVKAQLRAHTDEAIARGVFGVPTFAVDEQRFWGLDSLEMLRAYLCGDEWFHGEDWQHAGSRAIGVARPR